MIKFTATTPGGRVLLGLIITKGNIIKLKKSQPIHFSAEEMGLTQINCNDIIIAYYETQGDAEVALRKAGLISDETKIHVQASRPDGIN